MKKPKVGDRCVGVIVSKRKLSNIKTRTTWILDVPGISDPYTTFNNQAFCFENNQKIELNQIYWFEYKPWPLLPKHNHWQLVTEKEIETNERT